MEKLADFCQQCSLEIFTEDFRELASISTEKCTEQTKFVAVLCEGCGACQVDHNGICITHKKCLLKIKDLELRTKYWPEGEEIVWQNPKVNI